MSAHAEARPRPDPPQPGGHDLRPRLDGRPAEPLGPRRRAGLLDRRAARRSTSRGWSRSSRRCWTCRPRNCSPPPPDNEDPTAPPDRDHRLAVPRVVHHPGRATSARPRSDRRSRMLVHRKVLTEASSSTRTGRSAPSCRPLRPRLPQRPHRRHRLVRLRPSGARHHAAGNCGSTSAAPAATCPRSWSAASAASERSMTQAAIVPSRALGTATAHGPGSGRTPRSRAASRTGC